ncbi:MAG TPA: transposase [Candidatus Saccharimonadales bacterium]|nr:transposase [Candidatus Saccharimonadales bacterium]
MASTLTFKQFCSRFSDEDVCLEEIKRLQYPKGVYCIDCDKTTKHYKLKKRAAYSCKFCRRQIYPLAGTIFEKTTTPLLYWFYAMFLMTHTKAGISIKQLQRELGVTYKTAWRMFHQIKMLMKQNNGDLLSGKIEMEDISHTVEGKQKIRKWTLFNKLEISLVEKKVT